MNQRLPGDSAAVTFLSPIVGGHVYNLRVRVTFSPSQKGHKEFPGRFPSPSTTVFIINIQPLRPAQDWHIASLGATASACPAPTASTALGEKLRCDRLDGRHPGPVTWHMSWSSTSWSYPVILRTLGFWIAPHLVGKYIIQIAPPISQGRKYNLGNSLTLQGTNKNTTVVKRKNIIFKCASWEGICDRFQEDNFNFQNQI